MKAEIFKEVPGYDGYKISNLGRLVSVGRVVVRSNGRPITIKNKILKPVVDDLGYHRYTLTNNFKRKHIRVHQLVAMAFLNHKRDGYKLIVDHIDNNPSNNNLDNLRVITQRENTNRNHLKSSSKYTGVSFCNRDNKWKAQIQINGVNHFLGRFKTELEAHNTYQNKLKQIEK